MNKYKCQVCGYIYDPDVGCPISKIEPGIPFKDLPSNWSCPECGQKKESWPPWAKLDAEESSIYETSGSA